MRICFVASEANPFIKTGGLADVVFSLSDEFSKLGNEVSIIIPFYRRTKETLSVSVEYLGSFNLQMSWRNIETKVCRAKHRGISYYFIENDFFFGRTNVYGETDDGERFAYFTLASIEVIRMMNLKPNIIHIHDWQVGMLPCVIKEKHDEYFDKTRFVLTIHNPAFHGFFEHGFILDTYGLNNECYNNGNIRFENEVSTLKAGIIYADKITTVSPTHHDELLSTIGSYGLCGALKDREFDFCGVLNGIDYYEFDPESDKNIESTYNIESFYDGKQKNKNALLKRMGLPENSLPVFGLVSRLTWQKGINHIIPMIHEMVNKGCYFVILGSGEYDLEQQFEDVRRRYPDRVSIYIGYNDELAHLIYAGSDFFLMPSLFEPCGLSQMISERYGTLPIVRMTGGLRDSVICFDNSNSDVANGFGYAPNDCCEFIRTVQYAFDTYWNLPLRKKLIVNAMKTDNSWLKSAEFYLGIYREIIGK